MSHRKKIVSRRTQYTIHRLMKLTSFEGYKIDFQNKFGQADKILKLIFGLFCGLTSQSTAMVM